MRFLISGRGIVAIGALMLALAAPARAQFFFDGCSLLNGSTSTLSNPGSVAWGIDGLAVYVPGTTISVVATPVSGVEQGVAELDIVDPYNGSRVAQSTDLLPTTVSVTIPPANSVGTNVWDVHFYFWSLAPDPNLGMRYYATCGSVSPLQITCPDSVTVGPTPGLCYATPVVLGNPIVSGNLGPATVSNDVPGTFPVGTPPTWTATSLPLGTTTVNWTVTDSSGRTASCTQTVRIVESQAPTIHCPGNITVPATSASGAVVNYPAPTASDNCSTPTVVSNPPSGSTFPIGTTPVTCTATDASGNTATCSFTVTVTAADLSVSQSASPNPVVSGTNLTYMLTVQNAGPDTAQGVVLTDPLPSGTSFISATAATGTVTLPKKGSGSTVTWSLPPLARSGSATLTLAVKVSAKGGSTLTNTASVSSSSLDPNPGNNSSSVAIPVLAKR